MLHRAAILWRWCTRSGRDGSSAPVCGPPCSAWPPAGCLDVQAASIAAAARRNSLIRSVCGCPEFPARVVSVVAMKIPTPGQANHNVTLGNLERQNAAPAWAATMNQQSPTMSKRRPPNKNIRGTDGTASVVVAGPRARWRFVCETGFQRQVIGMLFRPAAASGRANLLCLFGTPCTPRSPAGTAGPPSRLQSNHDNCSRNSRLFFSPTALWGETPVIRGIALIGVLGGLSGWVAKPGSAPASASPQNKEGAPGRIPSQTPTPMGSTERLAADAPR